MSGEVKGEGFLSPFEPLPDGEIYVLDRSNSSNSSNYLHGDKHPIFHSGVKDVKTICAWCDKVMKEGETVDGKSSHGICLECLEKFYPKSYRRAINERYTTNQADRQN